jgi:hypothetical protein
MEERIKLFLENATTLRPIIIDEGTAKNVFPCITLHFYNENGALFGGGNATEETASCQIDFWYKVKSPDVTNTISEVKEKIKNERTFSFPKKETLIETDTKLYHTYLTFDLIKESGE